MTGLHLHIDCPSGIAGDMFVGAALDAGVPREVIQRAIDTLGVHVHWSLNRVTRAGMAGTKIHVHDDEHHHDHHHDHDHDHDHHHRYYRDIKKLLAKLPDGIQKRAVAIFERIAVVEAKIHDVAVDDVAFHEVGAIDSIFDVVAAAAALDWLAPARVTCASVPTGSGSVQTAHGRLPVPAPATVALLVGAPIETGGVPFELTTPTGAAILAASVDAWTELPSGILRATGYGAGDRDLPDRPNLLRLLLVEPRAETTGDHAVELDANVDDMSPQLAEPLMEALFAAGALDVWFTPIHMKKNRPAFQVSALAPPEVAEAVAAAFLRESTTLGVRRHVVSRRTLDRRIERVATPYGEVEIKLGLEGGRVVNAAPEYESVRRLAAERNIPTKEVWAAAVAAASALKT
jgi:uncharacterized protein (TIGR00299 family) protein